MAVVKIVMIGDLQAVPIPPELAFDDVKEVEIERIGDELRVRPLRRSLAAVHKHFAKFSDDFMAEGRGDLDQEDRDAL